MKKSISFILFLFFYCSVTAQKINPENPDLSPGNFKMDSLPNSEINIPIQINLKPVYAMAEKSVDTVFNSPGYPDAWVQEGCDTRYKYEFRRGPLIMKASGTSLNLGFTGYYKIVGHCICNRFSFLPDFRIKNSTVNCNFCNMFCSGGWVNRCPVFNRQQFSILIYKLFLQC